MAYFATVQEAKDYLNQFKATDLKHFQFGQEMEKLGEAFVMIRENLTVADIAGLGNAASLNVGTAAGTVAQGDIPQFHGNFWRNTGDFKGLCGDALDTPVSWGSAVASPWWAFNTGGTVNGTFELLPASNDAGLLQAHGLPAGWGDLSVYRPVDGTHVKFNILLADLQFTGSHNLYIGQSNGDQIAFNTGSYPVQTGMFLCLLERTGTTSASFYFDGWPGIVIDGSTPTGVWQHHHAHGVGSGEDLQHRISGGITGGNFKFALALPYHSFGNNPAPFWRNYSGYPLAVEEI